MVKFELSPSLLACDHCQLLHGVKLSEAYKLQRLHIDIMDGHFVKNISFGPQLVRDLRKHTSLYLDIHLMLTDPYNFVANFIDAGANSIIIHQESNGNIIELLSYVSNHQCLNGIAINPKTHPDFTLLPLVNFVLVMGVYPGFGNQKFITETLDTIKALVQYRQNNNLSYKIMIDGGITITLAKELLKEGIDIIISGSAFFTEPENFITSLTTTH